MKVAPMGEVRNNFAKYLTACEEEPVFVTRNGKIAAVIERLEDADVEDFLLERSARFRAMLNAAKRERGGVSLKEYRKARRI
ncbi:type II toxin-antitoxin system Phd/YefM family antitoxin [Candidatus Sumerlaeota bacterium]|nr:type II toxin-antitoxin system Phd/YefM family antitoxin [Candidatus Sumerlaeota bacterium]